MAYQEIIQQLGNIFLNPVGLTALAAIIPLLIFYLMRPSPEEKVMPSMKFFREDQKSGRLQKALKILQRNLMLFLHILIIAGIAAAIADPYIETEQRPENSVLVIDNSASMQPVFQEVKQEAITELGDKNTLIVANDEVKTPLKKASYSRTKSYIQGMEVEHTRTDIVKALEKASDHRGRIFIASDLDQSDDSKALKPVLNSLKDIRPVELYRPEKENSWGITAVEIEEENATAVLQSFIDQNTTVSFTVGEDSREIDLPSQSTREISFTLTKGENTIELEDDGFRIDNKAYIMNPRQETLKVALVSDRDNRYLMKGLELIEEVEPERHTPDQALPDSADVHIIGRIEDREDLAGLEQKIPDDGSVIMRSQKGLPAFQASPVKRLGEKINSTVTVQKPSNIAIGKTEIYNSTVQGEKMSEPGKALVSYGMGEGRYVYLNFNTESFRQDFMYPVFWKKLLLMVSDRRNLDQANLRSGITVTSNEKVSELSRTGFHELGEGKTAVNLFSPDESGFDNVEVSGKSERTVKKPESLRDYPVMLVVLLALVEIGYLYRTGDVP